MKHVAINFPGSVPFQLLENKFFPINMIINTIKFSSERSLSES